MTPEYETKQNTGCLAPQKRDGPGRGPAFHSMTFGALNNEIVGSHTRAEWEDLIARHGWRCVYCGIPVCENSHNADQELTKDHVFPTALGGVDFIHNIVPACARCNRLKGNRTAEEFRSERYCLPQPVDDAVEKSTGNSSLRGESDFARQSIRYLVPKLTTPDAPDPKSRRDLLKCQAATILQSRQRQILEAAGQLSLSFDPGKKTPEQMEHAKSEKSA